MDQVVVQLFANLAEIAARNTATAIATRVQAIKAKKNTAETVNELTSIIDELVSDRDEALRVARALKEQLVSQQISDDDIRHIVGTVVPAVRNMLEMSPMGAGGDDADEVVEQLSKILTPDTLKVLQTLGFNYAAAIGEPLTILLRNLILSQVQTIGAQDLALAQFQRDTEELRLVQDPEAYERLRQLRQ